MKYPYLASKLLRPGAHRSPGLVSDIACGRSLAGATWGFLGIRVGDAGLTAGDKDATVNHQEQGHD